MSPRSAHAALLVPLLLATACLSQERPTFGPTKRPRSENRLYFGGGAEPASIDPGLAYDSPGIELARNLFEGLTRYDPRTLRPLPGVAERWEVSEDGRRWRFFLRADARWSDGADVTARDFVWAWRRVLDPANAAQYASLLWSIEGAKDFAEGRAPASALGVRALDARLLEVRLERPVPWLLELLAFPTFHPVPRRVIEAHGAKWTRPENIVSNGPFVLEAWRLAYEIRLRRSAHYWGRDEVALDGAVAILSDDDHAMLRLYRAGELDWLGADVKPPQEFLRALQGKEDFSSHDELASYFYWVNHRPAPPGTPAPLHDVRVRRALNLAIDKDAIARFVLRGGERPARHVTPELFGALGYVAPEGEGYDPDRARALLAEAGWGRGKRPFPPFELAFNTNEAHKQVAEAIQQMWKRELGIEVELANYEWKVFLNNRTEGYFTVARAGWTGDFQDPYTFLSMFLSDSELNEGRWRDPAYDALLHRALQAPTQEERFRLYAQAEERLNRELPVIPVYFYAKQTLHGAWVRGLHPNSQDIHPLRDVSLEGAR